jgi:gamma-glutamyltranspeptidase / glutathione hydrolase
MPIFKFLPFLLIFSCSKPLPKGYEIAKQAFGEKGMVVTAHPVATQIGLDILQRGGNAIEAAIAVQFALAVCYPVAGNIGGGGFMVIREQNGKVHALDFRETAPALSFETMYQNALGEVMDSLSRYGHLAAGIPGAVDGMTKAHEKFGSNLTLKELIQPSIEIARNGFQLTQEQANGLNRSKETFMAMNTLSNALVKPSDWEKDDLLIQEDLAQTLERIADQGRDGFYKGKTADLIVEEMKRGKGIISHEDLENYHALWRDPIQFTYKDYDLIGMPPPSSGGIALAQLLKITENYPINTWGHHSKNSIHLMIEAERRVYADRSKHLGDSDFYPVPMEALLNSTYLKSRMNSFNRERATPSEQIQPGLESSGSESMETTHFSIVDQFGNAVAVTTTINGGYGNFVVVGGAGFLLNNEMDDFSAKPGSMNMFGLIGAEANKIEPGKRMLSSMTPTIITKNGKLFMVVGTPGGSTIITSVYQVILNVIEFDMTMAAAIASPRFHHQWLPDWTTYEESGIDTLTIQQMEKMGHVFKPTKSIGRVDGILVGVDGKLEGGADPRGDDHAAGY